MKLAILAATVINGVPCKPGDTIEVDNWRAVDWLLRSGRAQPAGREALERWREQMQPQASAWVRSWRRQ